MHMLTACTSWLRKPLLAEVRTSRSFAAACRSSKAESRQQWSVCTAGVGKEMPVARWEGQGPWQEPERQCGTFLGKQKPMTQDISSSPPVAGWERQQGLWVAVRKLCVQFHRAYMRLQHIDNI